MKIKFTRVMVAVSLLAAVLMGCSHKSSGNMLFIPKGHTQSYAIGGTVSGFAGSGLVLQNNEGDDLTISGDGSFVFAAPVASGATYNVTVITQPTCTSRVCTVTNGNGTVSDSDISNILITCSVGKIMFFSSNWGDDSVKITDDIYSLADGATATPRVVSGSNVPISYSRVDSLAVDRSRNMIYLTDTNNRKVYVFNNAATISGNVAPSRAISPSGMGMAGIDGIEVDTGPADRIYLAVGNDIWIFNHASTIDGTVPPDATISGIVIEILVLDRKNDRLYAGAGSGSNVYVFDHASTLATGAVPDRTITFSGGVLGNGLALDTCTDRMYVASSVTSAAGYDVFAFGNAGALNGTVNPDIDSAARISLTGSYAVMVDNNDRLYYWEDSATSIKIYENAGSLTGNVTKTPDRTINGVVNGSYGADYVSY